MIRSSCGALILLSAFAATPVALIAQEWSSEQQEVLDAIDACIQASVDRQLEVGMACTHDDFSGWRYDLPALRDKKFQDREQARDFDSDNQLVDFSVQPLNVQIFDNVAIIHYYGYFYVRDGNGEVVGERSRWTDVMIRDGGRWVWISDHGGSDPGIGPAGQN